MSAFHQLVTLPSVPGGDLLFRMVRVQVYSVREDGTPRMLKLLDDDEEPIPVLSFGLHITTMYIPNEQWFRNTV